MKYLLLFLFWGITLPSVFGQILGNPVFSWDFANGIPDDFTNGSTSGIAKWEYRGPNTVPDNTVCSRGSCGFVSVPITSVTASNGFVIFDSNYWDDDGAECGNLGSGQDPAPHNSWLITPSVSLVGLTGAVFTFQQQIRIFSATTKVQISINNGSTWADIIVNSAYNSPTAEWRTYNLSAYVGQPNVKFKFSFVGTYYHWAVDDITIYQPNQNDLQLTKPRYTQYGNVDVDFPMDMEYDQYPQAMIPAFKFSAVSTNIGSVSQSNVKLTAQVKNSLGNVVHTAQSSTFNSAPGATSTVTITNLYTPSAVVDDYDIIYKLTQTQTDQNLLNNSDTLDFSITPHTYARDEGPMEDVFTPQSAYLGQHLEVGNYFESRSSGLMFASIAVAVGVGTTPGTVIKGVVYDFDIQDVLATTAPYTVNAADINQVGEEKIITLPLLSPITLLTDSIYTVMVSNVNASQNLRVCRAGVPPSQTSYVRYPDVSGLFFLLKTPVVRMNIFPANAVPGCTNPLAMNYNPAADFDDGSCDFPGCTDMQASNYNPAANFDNGSCLYPGCTNPVATNYNPQANVDDGSCLIQGCTNPIADNFNPIANVENGSCIISGCTDPSASNFNPLANNENGSCLFPGCTNPIATNYDPHANVNNGSCIIPGCMNAIAQNYNPLATIDDGSCIIIGCTNPAASNYFPLANSDDGSCFFLGCTNPLADNFDPQATVDDGSCLISGCTNPIADNYNVNANADDGSCIISGCTDPDASNFDMNANTDDGSCYYLGCTDPSADNFDPGATVDDGNCIYYGCLDQQASNFDPTANTSDGSCLYSIALLSLSANEGCVPLTVHVSNQTDIQSNSICSISAENGFLLSDCMSNFDVIFDQPGEYHITYTYTQGEFISHYVSDVIVVHAMPAIPVLTSGVGSLTCSNCNGGDLNWYVDDTHFSDNDLNSISLWNGTTYENGSYTITETNEWGCNSASQDLLVFQPYFSQSVESGCSPLEVIYTDLSDAVNGISCDWTINGEIVSGATEVGYTYTGSGIFNTFLSCTVNGEVVAFGLPVEVFQTVIPEFAFNAESGVFECSNCEGNDEVSWFYNGEVVATDVNQLEPSGNGTYMVEISTSNGCSASSSEEYVAGITESFADVLHVFPNPANQFIRIKSDEISDFYEIRDSVGRMILSGNSKSMDFVVNISVLSDGFYTLISQNAGKTRSTRFMVMR